MVMTVNLQNLSDLMKLMAATERLFADFYRLCAEIWEEDREFWLATAAEEEKHAKNIERLSQLVAARPDRFTIRRSFNQTAIRTIMTGIEGYMKRLKAGQITRFQAMILARDLEASVMEKNYAEIVQTSDLEYLELMTEITQDTKRHKYSIEQRFQAVAAKGRL